MEKYYDGSSVLASIEARLIPPDTDYADCMCILTLTEEYLFVLEDEYDCTFTCHFKIPTRNILSMGKYMHDNHENNTAVTEGNSYSPVAAAIMAVAGVIMIPGKRQEKNAAILEVSYKNEYSRKALLFFEDCSNMKKIVRVFNKSKRH